MADYETITVNGSKTYNLDAGETLENILFDCSSPRADLTIAAHSTNWTIRNIGISGAMSCYDTCFVLSDQGGGTSTVENVYMGDGVNHNQQHNGGAVWVSPRHSGHIDFANVNIQEWADNAIYASAPGLSKGHGGTVDIDGSYSANNYISNFRMCAGSLTNSVAVNTSGAGWDGRCLWAWGPGDVEVDGCDIDPNGRHYSIVAGAHSGPSTVRVSNTDIGTSFRGGTSTTAGSVIDFRENTGTNPDTALPDGCPATAEEAASGGDGGGGGGSGPGSPVDQMIDPLPPTDPKDYARVLTFRSLDPNRACHARIWLETENANRATQVTPYGGTYEAVGVHTDEDRGGRVVITITVGGEDGGDPGGPAGSQARKSVAVRGDIHDIEMGPEAVDPSEALDPDNHDGPAQLETTNGDSSWITAWHPESLDWPDGDPSEHFTPLDPVDPAPFESSFVARNAASDDFEFEVWVAIPGEALSDFRDRADADYGAGAEIDEALFDNDLNRAD